MHDITLIQIIFCSLVILSASFIKGVTGFGFALLAVPFLSLIFPMQIVVPAMSLFNLITSLVVLFKLRERIKAYYFIPMFIASLGGIPLGIYALKYVSSDTLRLLTGIMVVIFSIQMLGKVKLAKHFLSLPIVFAGFISGALTSAISVGGPPLVIAMNRKGYDKNRFRGVFSWFSVFSSFFVTVAYFMKGMIEMESINIAIFCIPILFFGSHLGAKFSNKVDPEKFRKIVIGINIVTGTFIIISSLI
ncbi:sulfite exporter TauE/SafE family protein [Ancylomarina sp. 16SWW S1-10-2]|uniref:sulfite exporter TauE/SafE family protein n=1 Tax=Ancylomarina sp. 16SWW S1-10-2 TaxID=2499681 RepID=UPI0012AD80E5|nr:sulfite exporter TauE/SafE family protein [Ancylomarina sp. 16SWW S1-10-2]MRT93584.1 sulfite exporter TauE/SafE family protein [Ancylomarina sp. 16SWW S1-10-2]